MTENAKKADPNIVRRDFYRLALDWVHLRMWLPKPLAQENGRRSKYREYGHPAEWASDKCADIAAIFRSWHDLVAEKRSETPAPTGSAAELVQVVKGWKYLEPRFEQLTGMVDAEDIQEVGDLHREIRNALGFSNPRQVLPFPCPGIDCGLRTLTREIAVGRDMISCGSCGYHVVDDAEGKNYEWLIHVCLDAIIDSTIDI